jgi:hypothetical protein
VFADGVDEIFDIIAFAPDFLADTMPIPPIFTKKSQIGAAIFPAQKIIASGAAG